MSSGSWSHEVAVNVAAGRLFKAAMLDWHNLGPKIVPDFISSGSVVSGDGAVGAIREIKINNPAIPFSYVKERLDFVDHDKFEAKQTLVEGGGLGKMFESATTHFKFEPSSNGGCIVKVTATYKILPGVPDESAKAKEGITNHMKAAEAYLLANPTAYA
ncbi:pathogenesis-related protein 1-like [Asparagus officinalis]|uniref:pathogenesis-related protein 1-like n=1 Tax=Asparagus officinalis TaxID=4686 RepID=UPI00098E4DA1|nr:pathogenesis-related protein 1-like [Asparagus officinalis]